MRPWMKLFAVGGIVGAALGVSVAAEKPTERLQVTSKKPTRIGQFQSFSRKTPAAAGSSTLPSDPEVELLKNEVSETPKRFTRQKDAVVELKPTSQKSPRRNLEAELFGDEAVATAVTSTPTTKPSSKSSKPLKVLDESENVELVAPPTSEQAPRSTARKSKPSVSEILQAGLETPEDSPSEASVTGLPKSNSEESTEGVVAADYEHPAESKPAIRQVRAEQTGALPLARTAEPELLSPAAKSNRMKVVNDRVSKPNAMTSSQSSRPTSVPDRASTSKQTGSPAVSVDWVKRSEINVGQECLCDLLVKNTGKVSARDVVVEAFFPATVRLTHAEPAPSQAADHLEWSIPELAAGEEQTIHITMIPSQRGDLATTANVRFTGTAASVFKVEEPLLKVTIQAPSEVSVGDPLVQSITVTNPGTGVAQNVKIHLTTPAGLESTRGDRTDMEIGSLSPGESRTIRLSFNATAGGEQHLEVKASADSGLKQVAESSVNVIAASLNVAIEGPSLRYVGRDAKFALIVKNDGQAATSNVRVSHRIPNGFKFVKADKGGTFDASTGSVTWFVGHLEVDQTAQLKLQLQATELGKFEHHVRATSEHGLIAKADAITNVEGSAALSLEIQDLEDPVEVGQETAYEIRVSNSGSKAAEKVGLTFELPSGVELIKVQAATEHLTKNGLILFNDLAELAPGKTALFRIHVRGQAEGNQRVRARLTSESIDQELISEEITKFYAD